ncbi:hypothetical protein PEPS_12500 [Persicobacter psychrovividus]|uniref:Uncharacterized protein n=1 Tax=Persicobacter psychrovividus TaxID=387638 RepID=A0ABN6L702_9BACT|nr:hypothetical protein PEPS_12500 [Persicobacter psychrovividus]
MQRTPLSFSTYKHKKNRLTTVFNFLYALERV